MKLDANIPSKIIIFTVISALLIGIAVTLYVLLSHFLSHILFLGEDDISSLPIIYIYAVPILSILLVNWLISKDTTVREYGVAELAQAVEEGRYNITIKGLLLKIFASSISLASGFNVGNEGPSAAIGAMIAYKLNTLFKIPKRFLRLIISIGGSSGITAVFVSPITGIVFALENIAPQFVGGMVGPIILGATISFGVAYQFLEPLIFSYSAGRRFDYDYMLASLIFIPVILILLSTYFTIKKVILFYLNRFIENRLYRYRDTIFAIIGGLSIGTIILISPVAAFSGHEVVSALINNKVELSITLVITVALLRIIGTAISIYSNAVGGLFLPLMSIGALIGYAFAQILQIYGFDIHTYAFAAIGASVFMGVVMRLPLTAIVMSLELTYDYNVIVSTAVTMVLSGYLMDRSFNIKKLTASNID